MRRPAARKTFKITGQRVGFPAGLDTKKRGWIAPASLAILNSSGCYGLVVHAAHAAAAAVTRGSRLFLSPAIP